MTVELDVDPCAWLVGRESYWRPCGKETVGTVADGRLTAAVCRRHLDRALGLGWHEVEP